MTKIDKNKKQSKKKSSKGKYFKYSEKKLREALKAVDKGMSVRSASNKFKVPFSTIRLKSKGLFPIGKRSGPPNVLTSAEEDRLVFWVNLAEFKGFQLTTNAVLDSVKLLIKQCKRKNSFHDDRPGKHWYKDFLQRHKQLTGKIFPNKRRKQVPATERAIREWFEKIKNNFLEPKQLVDIDPSRIFNCNEVAFFLNPNDDNFILNKTLGLYNLNEPNNQECFVSMFTGNAAGQMLPPVTMFSDQEIPKEVLENVPQNWTVNKSYNGWMTGVTFYEYIVNVFYPWCCENNIQFPVILYLNEHTSYYTMALDDFCKSHQIELIPLYTNSFRINPMNVALFWPLKKTWEAVLVNWETVHEDKAIEKTSFIPILSVVLESIDNELFLKNGFSSCGLSPFSPDVINYIKLIDFGQIINYNNCYQQNSTVNCEIENKNSKSTE